MGGIPGDVDGDGDLDWVAGNSDVNQLYLGNGNGTFAAGSDIGTTAHSTEDLALGDLDGDGDLDLVTGNSQSRDSTFAARKTRI